MAIASATRHDLVRRGRQLEYFTIAYNSAEGLVFRFLSIRTAKLSLLRDATVEMAWKSRRQ
jgi:hypothetical protein